ncbi:hypothetical protein CTEN210_18067 [Chaetoceros tenuissimus]|uniref:Uncharacterized protein n=1 Tax=Chaetoceros tenuissimus TaxID=426638 RepID=A0AAD3HFP5_9STRA|nr:hypothetical protein CTEN210_18067 [Chaetoceros tenuissimus]
MKKKALVKKTCVVNTFIGVTILWFLLGSVLMHNLISKNHDIHEIKHRIQTKEDGKIIPKQPYEYNKLLDELDEISGGANAKDLTCPPPLVPFQNIIRRNNFDPKDRIPKILHFTMPSRCIPQDIYRTIQKWTNTLPQYSIFFHDDTAVEKLLSQEWNEFPLLQDALICVLFKGAMRIDVWRILLLYKYGGIYSDIDNWPRPKMNQKVIRNDVSAWFLTDFMDRPSQWFIAIEKHHPILYLTMHKIIDNLMKLQTLWRIEVVFVTGPYALKEGYFHFLNSKGLSRDDAVKQMLKIGSATKDILDTLNKDDEVMVGMENKQVIKLWNGKQAGRQFVGNKIGYDDIVPHPFNATLNITRGERIHIESGMEHWEKVNYRSNKDLKTKGIKQSLTCKQYIDNVKSGSMKQLEPW